MGRRIAACSSQSRAVPLLCSRRRWSLLMTLAMVNIYVHFGRVWALVSSSFAHVAPVFSAGTHVVDSAPLILSLADASWALDLVDPKAWPSQSFQVYCCTPPPHSGLLGIHSRLQSFDAPAFVCGYFVFAGISVQVGCILGCSGFVCELGFLPQGQPQPLGVLGRSDPHIRDHPSPPDCVFSSSRGGSCFSV
jgi:hypothetical protein